MTALLALFSMLGVILATGWLWTERFGPRLDLERRLVSSTLFGFVGLHLFLQILELGNFSWSRGAWFFLLVPALLSRFPRQAKIIPSRPPSFDLGFGDGIAAATLIVYAGCTIFLWNVHADFVYHWGPKAQKFYLADGVDWAYLAFPGNGHIHPDYPLFLPSLSALTARLAGEFDLTATLSWSVVFFALLLLACRSALRQQSSPRWLASSALAFVGLTVSLFAIGYRQAGGADWLMALAILAGTAILLGPKGPAVDWEVGIIAAFAAASKIEGIPFAAALVSCHLLRELISTRRASLSSILRTILPGGAVSILWAFQTSRYELLQPSNMGNFEFDRVGSILLELWKALLMPNWHGLSLCLFALPVLLAPRQTRFAALLCLIQLTFYVAIYLWTPVDAVILVRTSAPRLFFHLVPATWLLLFLALGSASEVGWVPKISPTKNP